MKSAVLLALALTSLTAFGESKIDLSKYQTVDMKQFDNPAAPAGSTKSGITFSGVTCRTEDGRELKQTDPEYQTCLVKAQSKANRQTY